MRFAFVISPSLGYRIPNLFQADATFGEFEIALQVLKKHGFDGVELNLNFDDQHKLNRIKKIIDDAELKLAAVGTGLLYSRDRLSFIDPASSKRAKALSILKELVRFASREHAPVIIGLVRGALTQDAQKAEVLLRRGLVECDAAAKKYGTKMALEAINRYETSFLNTADDAVKLIEEENLSATGLLLDTFHMNIEERCIAETIRDSSSRTVHFHIADSNRWPPGYGHLKVEGLLDCLVKSGYTGWVSAETLPKPNNTRAVIDTAHFLKTHKFMLT
jgi:sugar phosphate isomerase/epimerase